MSGIDRSPCASEIINKEFSDKCEAKFAGVGPLTENPITKEMIDWADKIICMERMHRDMLFEQFPKARENGVEVWEVSNDFCRYDKGLEGELRRKIEKELKGKGDRE